MRSQLALFRSSQRQLAKIVGSAQPSDSSYHTKKSTLQPKRVILSTWNRMVRMIRKGSIGFALVAMISVAGVARLLASLVATGKMGNVVCILILTVPLILTSGYLIDDKDSSQ